MIGNKGEWSELYAFFKLAADGKLYAADENINKINDIYYEILKIIRNQQNGKVSYIRSKNIKIIFENNQGNELVIPIEEFKKNAEIIFSNLKCKDHNQKGAFEINEVIPFMERIKCTSMKAKSTDKSDITLMVHDFKTGSDPILGFSIKSQLGSPSSLLNASKATNFIYSLSGHFISDKEKEKFNEFKYYKDKFLYLDSLGVKVSFANVENNTFLCNMTLVDTQMPKIMGYIVEKYYRNTITKIKDLVELCCKTDICSLNNNQINIFYPYKMKEFLTNIALGMVPGSIWDGKYETTGGYIIVKDNGDLLCYHIFNRNEFREYLYNNTKLDTPDKRNGFGLIYEEGNQQFLKLNLLIKFLK